MRNTAEVRNVEVQIDERFSTSRHGLFYFGARGQRLLVRGFTDGIAIVPGPVGGLWTNVRVDGVHHVNGLKKSVRLRVSRFSQVFNFLFLVTLPQINCNYILIYNYCWLTISYIHSDCFFFLFILIKFGNKQKMEAKML